VGTGWLSTVSKVGWVGKLGKGIFIWDAGGNAVMVGKGGIGIAQNGLNLQNGVQVFGGLFGLGGNVAGRYGRNLPLARSTDDAAEALPASGTGRAGRLGIDLDELRPTAKVASHIPKRPYINSPHTIRNIIESADPIPDPGGVPGALRWDVPGSFRGSAGTFELVIDPKTNRILHFLFRSSQ